MPTLVLSDTWQFPFARGDEKHKMLPHVTCGLLHHLSETQTPPDLGVFVSMVASWYMFLRPYSSLWMDGISLDFCHLASLADIDKPTTRG